MGRIDLLDSLLGYYCIKIKSKKWYHRWFFHLLDMTVVKAWLLWRRKKGNTASLVNFKLTLADLLCRYQKNISTKHSSPSIESGNRTGPKVQVPTAAISRDGYAHWPEFNDSRFRCKYRKCALLTYVQCEICNVALCLNKERNCFREFHT